MPRRRRHDHLSEAHPWAARTPANRCRALLVIDNAPLHAAAWAELVRARKRLEKATRDIHRHEETDQPAFRAWLARTFPTLLSAVRELAQQLDAKGRIVAAIERESYFTGRSAARIWREWQQNGGQPPPPPPGRSGRADPRADSPWGDADEPPDIETVLDEEMKRLFGEEASDENNPFARDFRDLARGLFGLPADRRTLEPDAREIYRRLVLHLHPDRGGEWTPVRARLWQEVQSAWAERDAGWLARLETEWEAATNLLSPSSPVSRLRAAVAELDLARRDAEKRVRQYRKDQEWRFSLRPASPILQVKVQEQLQHDERLLRAQLAEIERTIARWENAAAQRRSSRKRRPRHPAQTDLF